MIRLVGTTGEGPRRRYEHVGYALEPLLRATAPLRRPVFVVGCPRSGTTVFTDAFAGHQELANLSEAAWIWDRDYKDPRGDHLKTEQDVTPPERRRISGVVRLYMLTRPGQTFLNKHPRNSLRVHFLNALFPDCRFVHVVRDGRAVIASLLKAREDRESRQVTPYGNFCKPIFWRRYLQLPAVEQAAHQWTEIVAYTRRALGDLGPGRSLEIGYEDFCADPAAVLAECDRFCGLRPARARDLSAAGHLQNQNHKWRTRFSAADLDAIMRICGPLLCHLGYVADPLEGVLEAPRLKMSAARG